MTALQHVYLTAHGSYSAGHWLGETCQIGLRLAITDASDEPAKGASFTMGLSGDVVNDSGTTAGTNGTLTRTWAARLGPVGSTNDADAAWQIDLAEDFRPFLVAVAAKQAPNFRWTHVKIAPILAAGNYGNPAAIYQFTSPITGGASNAQAPEVSVALTLRAPVIGRRGRGRMYIPALGSATDLLASDGTVHATFASLLLTNAATLVTALENSPGTEDWGPTVVVTSAGSSDAVRPSQLRVGNHFDVQRRRQQQIPETYTTTAL